MNLEKLLKILLDIKDEEEKLKFVGVIELLKTQQQQNNVDAHSQTRDDLYAKLKESIVNSYISTDKKILRELKGERFFGNLAIEEIENILHLPTTEIPKSLDKYIAGRNAFLQSCNKILDGLKQFEFKPHVYKDEEKFDVSLIFPSEVKSIEIISEKIDQWQEFLHRVCEYTGEKKEKLDVSIVNNGCLEISVLITSPIVIGLVARSLKEIAGFIKEITEIQRNIAETDNLKIDTKIKKENIKNLQLAKSNKLEETIDSIVSIVFPLKNKEHEDNSKLRQGVRRIIKNLELNIKMEITPPRFSTPLYLTDENEQNKKQNQKLKKNFEEKISGLQDITIANIEIERIDQKDVKLLEIPESFYETKEDQVEKKSENKQDKKQTGKE